MLEKLYLKELGWIKQLQAAIQTPFLNSFFVAWNYVDSIGFSMLMIILAWHGIHRRLGAKLAYILLLSATFNKGAKYLFDLPRPCQMDPSVGLVCFSTPGFPSGAAQTAIVVALVIFIETKNLTYRILGLIFASLLAFSRIYLGVHFFTDILGGFLIGACLMLVYWKLFPLFEKTPGFYLLIAPFVFLIFAQSHGLSFFWVTLGLSLGTYLSLKKEQKRSALFLIWVLFGALLLAALALFVQPLSAIAFFFLGLWVSYLSERLYFLRS